METHSDCARIAHAHRIAFVLGLATFIVFAPAMLAPLVFAIGVDWVIYAAAACFGFAAVDWALDPWRARRMRMAA